MDMMLAEQKFGIIDTKEQGKETFEDKLVEKMLKKTQQEFLAEQYEKQQVTHQAHFKMEELKKL